MAAVSFDHRYPLLTLADARRSLRLAMHDHHASVLNDSQYKRIRQRLEAAIRRLTATRNIFIVFVDHLGVPSTFTAYRGDNGNIVVYETRAEAEAAAAELTAANKNPNISFTITEFEPTD
jgi:hypothetical protein